MDRWACVDLPVLPLQLLLKDRAEWMRLPCAVVEADAPQALVQFVNARACERGVRPGQRYATALALASDLRAGVVAPSQLAQHTRDLADRLRRHSPHVEPSTDMPGVFWLDAQGLDRLYPSLRDWAQAVRLEMRRAGMRAAVAVGFTRFGVYALARCHPGITVCENANEEHVAVQRVPLSSIDLDPDALTRLAALGIETMGGFLQLPADGIRQRFGASAHAVYQLAGGHRWAPLAPVAPEEPQTRLIHFDTPEISTERLIFIVKRLLDSLVAAIDARAHAIVALTLGMTLDNRTTLTEHVRPATPTLDATQLLALVRLRLEALRLPSGITTLRITPTTCPDAAEQRRLFPLHARRDPELANQAFARLRAEFGERAVVRARIGNAHLPAARFEWEPIDRIPLRASPIVVTARPLVRRIYTPAIPLAPGFTLSTTSSPASVSGPYTVSGGWWVGSGVRRDYYFAPTGDGTLLWVYFDHRHKRFFLQGCVE